MYDKERDMNPPEPREESEPDVDSINDIKWLEEHDEDTIDEHDCCRGDCK